MNTKRICLLVITLFFSLSVFSQIDSTRRDSIEEVIIYEYDTIYIQPDTIRITDTIYDIVRQDSLKIINSDISNKVKQKDNFSVKRIFPKSLSFSIAPFASINQNSPSDTLSIHQVFNMSYRLGLNYNFNKYKLSIGVAYLPYHEKYTGSTSTYSSNKDEMTEGTYDSLYLASTYQIDYYYSYLNLDLILGRKFITKHRFSFLLNLGASVNILADYSQGNTPISEEMIKKTNFSFIFLPELSYKFGQKLRFKLLPFYQYAILEERKYPFSLKQSTGINMGFDIIF